MSVVREHRRLVLGMLAAAVLAAVAAALALTLAGDDGPPPVYERVGEAHEQHPVTVAAEDGASITVPAGAAEAGAEIVAEVVEEEEWPVPPLWAADFTALWDFEVEGGITEPVQLTLPLPEAGEAWSVVHFDGESWELVPFEIVDGMVSTSADTLSPFGFLDFGGKLDAVMDCVSDPLDCGKEIVDTLANCVARPKNCAEVVVDEVSDLAAGFWGAAKEGTRVIVGALETGYSYVKRGGEWVVEFGSELAASLLSAANGLLDWFAETPSPLDCEDSEAVSATLNPGQVLLDSCAEDEGEETHQLRVKNMRRFWIQACPGHLRPPDLERAPNLDVLGPLSNCDSTGGTLLPSESEAEWLSQLEGPATVRATFSDSAALMTAIDWILSILGVSNIAGKAGEVAGLLADLQDLPALAQFLAHVQSGRIGDAFSELGQILISPSSLKEITRVVYATASRLGLELKGKAVIYKALLLVEIGRVPIKIADLLSAHFSSSGTFAEARFERLAPVVRPADAQDEEEGSDSDDQEEPDELDPQADDEDPAEQVEPPLSPIGDGSLIVRIGTSDLYQTRIVEGKHFKRLILNEAVFDGYSFQIDDIRRVGAAEFERWQETNLARLGENARVWRLLPDAGRSTGERRWLDVTARQFEEAGFDWDAVIPINRADFDQWREGAAITAADLDLEAPQPLAFEYQVADQAWTIGEEIGELALPPATGGASPYAYQVQGLPDGMSFASGTRRVTGTPAGAAGTRTLWFSVSDAAGASASVEIPVTLRAAEPPTQTGGRFVQVSAGGQHTCGLRVSGEVECWGAGYHGQSSSPAGAFEQVSAGGQHTCGLRVSGEVECWGENEDGQSSPPAGAFEQVSAGADHTCGLRTGGEVECWGGRYQVPSPPSGVFEQVSVSVSYTCGLRTGGQVECWGVEIDSSPPAGAFEQVSAGRGHACGLRADGKVECWGAGYDGQSSPLAGAFEQVSAGLSHTCGLRTGGEVECWGADYDGQSSPPAGAFEQVSAGLSHTCGLRTGGEVECWGADYNNSPPSGAFEQVSAGMWHACGLRAGGKVECWDIDPEIESWSPSGAFAQVSVGLGFGCEARGIETFCSSGHWCGLRFGGEVECSGNDDGQSSPLAGAFEQVSAGADHTCGVHVGGEVECWGRNDYGQSSAPSGLFKQVSAGADHTCGVHVGGEMECWGGRYHRVPSPPSGVFEQVSAGLSHTCGLRTGGEVECWSADYQVPSPPSGVFEQVSAGGAHTCGLRPSGRMECWHSRYDAPPRYISGF